MILLPLGLAALLVAAPVTGPSAVPPAPVARIVRNLLTHPAGDIPVVRVPRKATYAGGERFQLFQVADCELHVFVEADAQRRVRRLYWVQYESYLPTHPRFQYDYAAVGDRRMRLWNAHVWVNASHGSGAGPVRKDSDTEHVRALLAKRGYVVPAEAMNVRFVRLLDDPAGSGRGRRELMFIYSEDLRLTGRSTAQLTADPKLWERVREALVRRATAAFRVG